METLLKEHIAQLVSLTDEEFNHISNYFTPKRYKKHQFVVQEGNMVDHKYFVVSGLMKSSYTNDNGRENIIHFPREGWWMTDFEAFYKKGPATLNIDCIEDSIVLGISYDGQKKLCDEMHKMEHFFRMKSAFGYISLQQRVLSLMNDNVQVRYDKFVSQHSQLLKRIPKSLLASYLGVSRETLSRLPGTMT